MQNQEFFKKEQVGELVDWLLSKVEKHFGELPNDLSDVYVGKIVNEWVSEKSIAPTTFSVEKAEEVLRQAGYCGVTNYKIEDYRGDFKCDDETLCGIVEDALNSDSVNYAIDNEIDFAAEKNGLFVENDEYDEEEEDEDEGQNFDDIVFREFNTPDQD